MAGPIAWHHSAQLSRTQHKYQLSGGGEGVLGHRGAPRAQLQDILRELPRQLQQPDVRPRILHHQLGTHLEHAHVPHEEQQLVEADVLVGLLLALLPSGTAPRLDVPDPDGALPQLGTHPGLLIDGLEESGLPPLDLGPDLVGRDEFLELHLAACLEEVVGEGEDHKHLGVIGVELDVALL